MVGRFGIIPEPGPVVPPPLQEAIHRIYFQNNSSNYTNDDTDQSNGSNIPPNTDEIRAGAIVYMFVEPEYRGAPNNIGGRALEVIHTLQRSCHCTYNLLVANDKTPLPPPDYDMNHPPDGTDNDTRYDDMKLVQWYRRNGYHIAEEIQDMLGSPNGIYGIAMIKSLDYDHTEGKVPNQNRTTKPIIQWW